MGGQLINIGMIMILIPIGIALIWAGVSFGSMHKKFQQLGQLKGLTYSQIVSSVGKDASATQHVQNGSIRVWQSMDYQITLVFDKDEVCQGISNEASAL